MRRKKPWEKLGISRATWYRHGKPTTKPKRMTVAETAKMFGFPSKRTYQRGMRILQQSDDLAPYVLSGALKPGQAERLLKEPEHMRRFLDAVEHMRKHAKP